MKFIGLRISFALVAFNYAAAQTNNFVDTRTPTQQAAPYDMRQIGKLAKFCDPTFKMDPGLKKPNLDPNSDLCVGVNARMKAGQ
jgi:hypothetical protein